MLSGLFTLVYLSTSVVPLLTAESGHATVVAAGFTWIHKPGEAITDGNIVSAWRRPDHDVWLREFMKLLKKRGAVGAERRTCVSGKARCW